MADEDILIEIEERMEEAVEATRHECQKIRTGRANIALLDGISAECYGASTPINHLANITVPEPRMILIQPYDRSIIKAIETAIMKSGLGITPNNDGVVIRLTLPELTGERRKELVRVVKRIAEEGKVALRNHRHRANDKIKKGEKDGEIPKDESKRMLTEVQKLTEDYSKKIDEVLAEKEEEILNF
jgi:ribosome recycling factor